MFETIPIRTRGSYPFIDAVELPPPPLHPFVGNQYVKVPRIEYEHGTLLRWLSDCRCEPCRGAREASSNNDVTAAMAAHFPDRTHGTVSTYGYGCRCEPCRAKKAEMNLRYNTRVRDARKATSANTTI